MKKTLKLTESDLTRLVKKIVKEQSKGSSSNPVKLYDDSKETKFLDTAFVVGPGKVTEKSGAGDAVFPAERIGNVKGQLRIDCNSQFPKFYFFEGSKLTLTGYNKAKKLELCLTIPKTAPVSKSKMMEQIREDDPTEDYFEVIDMVANHALDEEEDLDEVERCINEIYKVMHEAYEDDDLTDEQADEIIDYAKEVVKELETMFDE